MAPAFTERVRLLIAEAESLRGGNPVVFEEMTDPLMLEQSAGAAIQTDTAGRSVIYLDPARADECMAAHELMHMILHYSGCPQVFSLLTGLDVDTTEGRLADAIDNVFDHYAFGPQLAALGFDPEPYRRWYVSIIDGWPHEGSDSRAVVANALAILDGLIFGPPYRELIIARTKQVAPKALALARNLEHRVLDLVPGDFAGCRGAMIDLVDYLSRWISKQAGQEVKLRKAIGVTPSFSESDYGRPASQVMDLVSYAHPIGGAPNWLLAFLQRGDNVRFHALCYANASKEPREVAAIRERWQQCDLETFLREYGVPMSQGAVSSGTLHRE
jgi:hypothetical protein